MRANSAVNDLPRICKRNSVLNDRERNRKHSKCLDPDLLIMENLYEDAT